MVARYDYLLHFLLIREEELGGEICDMKGKVNLAFSSLHFSALLVGLALCCGDAGVTSGDFSLPRALAPSECVNVEFS